MASSNTSIELVEYIFQDIINSETGHNQGQEFISDDFDPSELNPDDLEREMKQLGMEDGGDVPEWEKELQMELQVDS